MHKFYVLLKVPVETLVTLIRSESECGYDDAAFLFSSIVKDFKVIKDFKVMFLHLSVILFTGGLASQPWGSASRGVCIRGEVRQTPHRN